MRYCISQDLIRKKKILYAFQLKDIWYRELVTWKITEEMRSQRGMDRQLRDKPQQEMATTSNLKGGDRTTWQKVGPQWGCWVRTWAREDPAATRKTAQSRKGWDTVFSVCVCVYVFSNLWLVSPMGQTSFQAKRHRSLGNIASSRMGQIWGGQRVKLRVNGQMIGIATILIAKEIAL